MKIINRMAILITMSKKQINQMKSTTFTTLKKKDHKIRISNTRISISKRTTNNKTKNKGIWNKIKTKRKGKENMKINLTKIKILKDNNMLIKKERGIKTIIKRSNPKIIIHSTNKARSDQIMNRKISKNSKIIKTIMSRINTNKINNSINIMNIIKTITRINFNKTYKTIKIKCNSTIKSNNKSIMIKISRHLMHKITKIIHN